MTRTYRPLPWRHGEQTANFNKPYYEIRLSDLERWHLLVAKCNGCGHRREVRIWRLRAELRHLGTMHNTRLVDFERRLRCQRCGNRHHKPGELTQAPSKAKTMIEPRQGEFELIHYETPECSADFSLDPSNETIWATQQQIADLFGVSTSTVGEHLQNIFREGELDADSVSRKFRATGKDGKNYNYLHYSLDAVLSVGYRVSSKRATAFRRWATQTLKDYIVQGFALDEQRLRDDPKALRELAGRVRALRADEKNIYGAVRDVFAFASQDYVANSQEAKSFYARLQDKFTFAITGQTSSQILLERANHLLDNVGLQTMASSRPQMGDVTVAKNYLNDDELYSLHILCEQFLLFVESRSLRGHRLTMQEMSDKFDDLIEVQGHPIFKGYKDYLVQKAKNHAIKELERYRDRVIADKHAERKRLSTS